MPIAAVRPGVERYPEAGASSTRRTACNGHVARQTT